MQRGDPALFGLLQTALVGDAVVVNVNTAQNLFRQTVEDFGTLDDCKRWRSERVLRMQTFADMVIRKFDFLTECNRDHQHLTKPIIATAIQ